ncbi:MAG: LPXTG cell wall anchor domain-containing protein [Clostridia bacterium]|nr:LPXTG cell wall anchor domain-containing protein [Clostridia bacterium]
MISKIRHRTIWLLAIVLLVSTCATTIAFANIMGGFNMDDSGAIALINETDETEKAPSDSFTETKAETETEAVTESDTETETIIPETEIDTYDPEVPVPDARPGFEASDSATVWSTKTDVEIFRVSYENGEQKVTVKSDDGDKLIAPGTENSYTFKLKNTGNVSLKYTLDINAKIEPAGITIPITARLVRHDGKWVTEGGEAYVSVPRLDAAADNGELGAGKFVYYTLDWQWPFESGNDERDTLLGNMALDEDITFTIEIVTKAEYDGEIKEDIGVLPPQTGDNSHIILLVTLSVTSVVIILFLLLFKRRDKDDDIEEEPQIETES